MVRIKKGPYGARLERTMAIWAMMDVCKQAIEQMGFDYEISSGIEGEHMIASLHWIGNACDWAIRSPVFGNQGSSLALRCNDHLGDDFDILWNDQKKILHSEWQPKTSYGKLGQ
jgi:hypothetical protein